MAMFVGHFHQLVYTFQNVHSIQIVQMEAKTMNVLPIYVLVRLDMFWRMMLV